MHGKFAKLQELRAASWAIEVLKCFLLGYGTCILRGLLLLTLKIYKRASLLQFSTGCLVFMTRKCTKYGFCRISGWIENSENWILGFFFIYNNCIFTFSSSRRCLTSATASLVLIRPVSDFLISGPLCSRIA